ncbi:hypothetical protein C7974DRAFT_451172 [Boeremia exigua]|uniref:uncharacterized protein n=1 Tax=Boeremia exigua TaxID=749465 RepID=UPI001E8CEE32|nr:uncharacterized protein C7974DRAFT_451172 [Boeremia exigua]KAH6637966.1 hypothetical protein C7974DRAFT_451172 [Boeremia exigua]
MPRAYTLSPRPQNFSTTASLINRLRHPLRISRVRRVSISPSHSPSARTRLDKRRPRASDECVEASTPQSSPHELVKIEDRGEYTEQRYGDVNLYWNSEMVETNEQGATQRKTGDKNARRKRQKESHVFDDTEQLCRAYHNRYQGQGSPKSEKIAPQQTNQSTNPAPNTHHSQATHLPTHRTHRNHSTPTATSSSTDPPPDSHTFAHLTWNSALAHILSSPLIDPSIKAAISARSNASQPATQNGEVAMCAVNLVPNFSYPIPSARWYDTATVSAPGPPSVNGNAAGLAARDERRRDSLLGNGDTAVLDVGGADADEDSLYRAPTPGRAATYRGGAAGDVSTVRGVRGGEGEILDWGLQFRTLA